MLAVVVFAVALVAEMESRKGSGGIWISGKSRRRMRIYWIGRRGAGNNGSNRHVESVPARSLVLVILVLQDEVPSVREAANKCTADPI